MMHVSTPHGHDYVKESVECVCLSVWIIRKHQGPFCIHGSGGNTGFLLDALALCLCLSIYDSLTDVHVSTVCQTPFTVTAFFFFYQTMNKLFTARASEWLRKKRDDSRLFNNIFLSFRALLIIQTPLWSGFTTSLFVSQSLEANNSQTERCRGSNFSSSALPIAL